jgi:predicted RNA methylase
MELSDRIYSIHLSNLKSREFICRYVSKFGWKVQSIHSQKLIIKSTFSFHKKPVKQILADVYKICPEKSEYEN